MMETQINEAYGKIIAPGTIRFKRILPGPIENVWSFLTDSEKRGKWLASGQAGNKKGEDIRLDFLHKSLSKEDDPTPEKYKDMDCGAGFTGQIKVFEPPHLLSFTWGEADGTHSEVTFELVTEGDNVLLTLTHRNLADDQLVSVASGWHTHLGILADVLEGKSPKAFWKVHMKVEKEYQSMI